MFYILEATLSTGEFGYYTGRAGAGWVSTEVSEAFRCETRDFAEHRAAQFNGRSALHGLTFEVVPMRKREIVPA